MTEQSPLARYPAQLVGSFPDPGYRLEPPRAEFAFLGRSNVGKSSLLNALLERKTLARVSATPGKTQLLNAYRLEPCYLIDLPGYGWARSSKSERERHRRLIEAVLQRRDSLTGIVWLLDSRHEPSRDDREFHRILVDSGKAVLAVLTKADKLTSSERTRAIHDRTLELGFEDDQVQLVSARTGAGIADLAAAILEAASQEQPG